MPQINSQKVELQLSSLPGLQLALPGKICFLTNAVFVLTLAAMIPSLCVYRGLIILDCTTTEKKSKWLVVRMRNPTSSFHDISATDLSH